MRLTDIFPSIPRVKRLVVCTPELSKNEIGFWVWFRSFQGLINRREPHFYVLQAGQESRPLREDHWLDYYAKTFDLPVEQLHDVDAVLERYKRVVEGYVLYDNEEVVQTQNLAITRCGLEGVLPISPDQEPWMRRHGIRRRDDLRGKFRSNTEAAEWAIEHLWPQCSKRLYANLCVHRPFWCALDHALEDFLVYHRVFTLDLPLSRQTRRTLQLYRRLLESAAPPGAQLHWHCILDQEKEYVAEAARFGFLTLCSVATPNLTIHGGVGDPEAAYAQPMPSPETCQADRDKVYLCLYVTDGDATWAMNNLHSGNWESPSRGGLKLGWGMLPLMVKLMPAMVRYYHETRTPQDCFWGPSSGAGYTYSHLWPKDLAEGYLRESRRLLDQTGQHGCNMVNWLLRDWWREVEDEAAVRREQTALMPGPGLVCGLGGSPYARSYVDGSIPKLHSVYIANAGHDNLADILRLTQECPTRPLFLFVFVQIADGVVSQLEREMKNLAEHPGVVLLSMDEFFLTLQDARDRGLLGGGLYEKTEALAGTWLKTPGRRRLPFCEWVARELAETAHAPSEERRRRLAEGAWTDLVSIEIDHAAQDHQAFRTRYEGRSIPAPDEEADALLYAAFTVAWAVVRAVIQACGIYPNHRNQCLEDFRRLCRDAIDMTPFEALFAAWETWETASPDLDDLVAWCDGLARSTALLSQRHCPSDS